MKTSNLRCYVTLFDKKGKKIKSVVIKQSFHQVAKKLNLDVAFEQGDTIQIQEEGK